MDTVSNLSDDLINGIGGGRVGAGTDEDVQEKMKRCICPVEEHDDVPAEPLDNPPVKVVRDPGMPTKEEYDDHMKVHMPFRAWCPFCVMGKAGEDPHWKNKKKKEGDKPTICMDYKVSGRRGPKKTEEKKRRRRC